ESGSLRLRTAPLQSALPRDRKRAIAALSRSGAWRDRLQPAGRWFPHSALSIAGSRAAGNALYAWKNGGAVLRALLAPGAVRGGGPAAAFSGTAGKVHRADSHRLDLGPAGDHRGD